MYYFSCKCYPKYWKILLCRFLLYKKFLLPGEGSEWVSGNIWNSLPEETYE